jgi:hypothetical protein
MQNILTKYKRAGIWLGTFISAKSAQGQSLFCGAGELNSWTVSIVAVLVPESHLVFLWLSWAASSVYLNKIIFKIKGDDVKSDI